MSKTYRLFLRDLVLPCSIGIHPHEQNGPQPVRINLELEVTRGDGSDAIVQVVSYDHLVDGVKSIIGAGHINLAETLADRIADMCLADERVVEARVRLDKLEPFAEADSVGVEMIRRR